MTEVSNFSGGRTSGFMTENLLAGGWRGHVVFANTGLEDEETLKFVDRCSRRWKELYGVEVVWIEYDRKLGKVSKRTGKQLIGRPYTKVVKFETASREGEPFLILFEPRKDLPNIFWRECTKNLKIWCLKKYMRSIGIKTWISYVGIRYDEPERWQKDDDVESEYGYEVEHPLVKWKTTKPDVISFWKHMPFDLEIEDEIFGNCDLCFLKGPLKRMEVLRRRPQRAKFWIRLEEMKKKTFVNGITTKQLLLKTQSELFVYNPDENFDIPCTCNLD
jgi:hypothetical protein